MQYAKYSILNYAIYMVQAHIYACDSWCRHMLGLQVWSWVGAHARGNQSMFLSHINVSFPIIFPPFPCL